MSSSVDQIKSRIDIVSLVSSYMKLDQAGGRFKGKCPFHTEKTPSFFVSPDRGSYYCFGCGASGDIFSFVEEFEGLDFRGALKLLADRAGVKLESYSKEAREAESEKEKLFRIMEEATKFFENNLKNYSREGVEALKYLETRGITEKTVKDFRIGLAVSEWRSLYEYLKVKGFTDHEIERAGLAKRPEDKNKAMYDRFRGRVMFPIADSSGRIIAFSGRILADDGKSAKYINSPETPIFNKSATLFGIDKAKDSIRKNNFSILVEGQMDLVLSHQAGFRNTIASSGTAVADSTMSKENVINNLGLVSRLSKNIVLGFDADKAGISASSRFTKIALSLGMDVKVAKMPEGLDPADVISKKGIDAWREAIRNSKHFIEFMLEKILEEVGSDSRKVGMAIRARILPFVNYLVSSIEKSHFLKMISDKSGIPEQALIDDLKKVELELKVDTDDTNVVMEDAERRLRKDPIERRLLGIAFWQEDLPEKSIDPNRIFQSLSRAKEFYQEKKDDLIYEAEEFYADNESLEKDVEEMLLSLEEEYLNEELLKKMMELKDDKNKGREIEILERINEINKRKEEIKNSRYQKK